MENPPIHGDNLTRRWSDFGNTLQQQHQKMQDDKQSLEKEVAELTKEVDSLESDIQQLEQCRATLDNLLHARKQENV